MLAVSAVAVLYVKVDELGERLASSRARREVQSDVVGQEDPRYIVNGSARSDLRAAPRTSGSATQFTSEIDQNGEIAALREEVAGLKRQVQKEVRSAPRWSRPQFARSVDDLATRLSLAPSQKDRVKVAIERGQGRIDDILSIPGADGISPKQARLERQKKFRDAFANPEKSAQKILTMAMSGHRLLGEKIPGRNETYRQEIARIENETREEVGQNLTEEQKKQFKDMRIDPLIGSPGGSTVSFATSLGGDGSSGLGGFLVGEKIAISSAGEQPVPATSSRVPVETEEEKDGQ